MSTVTIGVSLEVGCAYDSVCSRLAGPLLEQLSSGYERCSVLDLPASLDAWLAEHRTARKRAHRAEARGYTAAALAWEDWQQDMFEINTSTDRRQGRPMSAAYMRRQTYSPLPEYPCDRHAIRTTGVWAPSGHLVAYLAMYRCGDLALVSQILGHHGHLENEIMFLLFRKALSRELGRGLGVVVYNRHDSGGEGLRWHKERFGFEEREVAWLP